MPRSLSPIRRELGAVIARVLGVPADAVQVSAPPSRLEPHLDLVVRASGFSFLVQIKERGGAGEVASAISRVQQRSGRRSSRREIPLIVVRFMGETGRDLCDRAGLAWLDLSGNARIVAPGLRIDIQGRPNRSQRRGRPANLFAPKSSRLSRQLLLAAEEPHSQKEIAEATGLGPGYVSRIAHRLEEDGLVVRNENGAIRPRDPALLLDAWRERYRFEDHSIRRGHVPARSGEDLQRRLTQAFEANRIPYAATGLGAAWLLSRFATFRLVTIYLPEGAGGEVLDAVGFRDEERGGNVWLVEPNDEGVMHGSQEVEGIRCVSPIQVYLDLTGHPERSAEAAERLREDLLIGLRHA